MLVGANVFMTIAWYWHLKFKNESIWLVIFASWGIALLEYCLQVPANRWGNANFTVYQLKIIQEVITLAVFMIFAMIYFKTWPAWNQIAAFVCIFAAAGFAFLPEIEKEFSRPK